MQRSFSATLHKKGCHEMEKPALEVAESAAGIVPTVEYGGVRISTDLHDCRGPITIAEGAITAFVEALRASGVNVQYFGFKPYPDDTTNLHADLGESHCSGGTYLKRRQVHYEVVMCFESRDNTDLARAADRELQRVFNGTLAERYEMPWRSP
ncbi:hypothetical protein A2761_00570 [Candidatus Kaiserbacteria bacterium RIFCSPHIGHO2_01_FULL_51_33]|uniref:Uncharacterized protein n=1 Tax=Candidatus Kaiserbacteria bacterium RIFCSPLOWO2_01_FULL_51_21 TaxID=1798508 RepID=A0A1F6EDL8_9BACT|nr:MAG: hypothetical protein A2761_00570 [Candidatus Kaiserbacteria bacterium RIFCSPHIGHO2_01_FULL_51_33]OGG71748.1 MAG: hypothetical protein A3A35_01995 [Candidatus Kaiserbacteria bacterium RIFCSPLOWO2_01_FULL_51_21]